MPIENGEISGFIKVFYGILITLAVCGGLYAIMSSLVQRNSFFENMLMNDILNPIQTYINTMVEDSKVLPGGGDTVDPNQPNG